MSDRYGADSPSAGAGVKTMPESAGDDGPDDSWSANGARDTRGKRSTGRGAGRSGRGRWAGAGGRWWVWIGRAILWAFIVVVLVNGILAPVERFTADKPSGPARTDGDDKARFPAGPASAYALEFAKVYLNYDQRTAADREQQLRFFLPAGADGQFGWNGSGQLSLLSVQVAGVEARDANNAVVTMLVKTHDTGDHWFQLAVPVYAKDGAMAVSARPALLPPPPRAGLPQQGSVERDTALETELQQTLEGFFAAYGSGNGIQLSRFLDHSSMTGLGGSVTFARLGEIVAPVGGRDQRDITVTVSWRIPSSDPKLTGAELELTYELTVVKKNGTWYVRDISGSTRPAGS